MRSDQKGFSLVEVMVVVMTIALVAGVGFYIYNTSRDELVTTNKSELPRPKETATDSEKKYLEIEGLGIKFETNEELKNPYYTKINGYYYFSTHEIDHEAPLKGCRAHLEDDSLGVVALIDGKPGEDKDETAEPDDVWTVSELEQSGMKKINDTYYGFMRGNGICYDAAQTNEQQEKLVDKTIREFIKQASTFTEI